MYIDILKAINSKLNTVSHPLFFKGLTIEEIEKMENKELEKKELKNFTPYQIPITSAEETDGIERPCFMVDFIGIKEDFFMNLERQSEFVVNIKYFASNRKKSRIENLKMIDELSKAFIIDNIVEGENVVLEIFEEVEINIVDSVLHFNIPLFVSEYIDKEKDLQEMEDLSINI